MTTFNVAVTQVVAVTIDETKFDDVFMEEFRDSFFNFDEIEEHAEHLAQLYARGICDNGDFIEGYGPAKEMGIRFTDIERYKEIVE